MKQEVDSIISIRQAIPEDLNFVMATWLRGLYYGNPWFKEIKKDNFMAKYHDIITKVLSKETTRVKVAALIDDQNIILGYSVQEPALLHWIFVKEAWRRMGIAKRLTPERIDVTTHLTVLGRKLKPQDMEFNPFLI